MLPMSASLGRQLTRPPHEDSPGFVSPIPFYFLALFIARRAAQYFFIRAETS